MCSQHVAIVHEGKCGTCAPSQLPGGFPFCASDDRLGVSPVCGKDGITYRNSLAAAAASTQVASNGTCTAKQCSEEVRRLFWGSLGACSCSHRTLAQLAAYANRALHAVQCEGVCVCQCASELHRKPSSSALFFGCRSHPLQGQLPPD